MGILVTFHNHTPVIVSFTKTVSCCVNHHFSIGRLCRNSGEHFTSFRDGISEKAAQRHQERNKGDQTEEVSTAMHVSKFQESYFFGFLGG